MTFRFKLTRIKGARYLEASRLVTIFAPCVMHSCAHLEMSLKYDFALGSDDMQTQSVVCKDVFFTGWLAPLSMKIPSRASLIPQHWTFFCYIVSTALIDLLHTISSSLM